MGSNQQSGISFPDLLQIAQAHGIRGVRLDSHDGLKRRIAEVIEADGPVLCEIMMDPDQAQAPRPINRKSADGTVKQTPLEDMHPFLAPREVAENMDVVNKI